MPPPLSRRKILLAIPGTFLLAHGAHADLFTHSLPDDLDLSLTRVSERGLYRAALAPELMPVPAGKMHRWTVMLQTRAGATVPEASLSISGGMPQHGHGLPTAPQVTKNLGEGRYLIEGVKFNMRGWWRFEIAIDATEGSDVVIFDLVL